MIVMFLSSNLGLGHCYFWFFKFKFIILSSSITKKVSLVKKSQCVWIVKNQFRRTKKIYIFKIKRLKYNFNLGDQK